MSAFDELRPQQQRFVEEYMVDLCAKQACIRAGYSEKTAESQGSRLLSNVKVSAAIAEEFNKVSEQTGLTVDFVVQGLLEVARRCLQHEPVMKNGEPTGEYTFNAAGANKAYELLGRHLGMFSDHVEITHHQGVVRLPSKKPIGAPVGEA